MSKQFKDLDDWRLGFRYSLEHNNVRDKTSDTLTPFAFSFDSYSVYLRSDEKKKNRYGITFFTRSDNYPVGREFIKGDRSYNLNLQTEILANSPIIKRSIERRNPYIDPLNFIQVATLRELRAMSPDDPNHDAALQVVLNTINGIAAGMKRSAARATRLSP